MSDNDRIPPIMKNPAEAERIRRLRDAVEEIWGESPLEISGVNRGPDGEMQVTLKPKAARSGE